LQNNLDELPILKTSKSKSQKDKSELEASRNRRHSWHVAAAIRDLVLDHDPRTELVEPNRMTQIDMNRIEWTKLIEPNRMDLELIKPNRLTQIDTTIVTALRRGY